MAQLALFAEPNAGPEGLRYQPEFVSSFTLTAEPRSLYMMRGESRQIWQHSIPAVEQRRYSITFRTMR
jgi:alkylated DNA repair dioxygenase AlkB